MPRTEYRRVDLPIRIRRDPSGLVVLRVGAAPTARVVAFGIDWLTSGALRAGDVSWLLGGVQSSTVDTSTAPSPSLETVRRVVLDVPDAELAAVDWETLLAVAASEIGESTPTSLPWTIVRACPVRPRWATAPLTLPVRILQLNPQPGRSVAAWVAEVFGGHPPERVSQAVMAHATRGWAPPDDWATVDVLHIDELPTLRRPDLAYSTADPDLPGTLGWLGRWTERWQTRLVVLLCGSAAELAVARRVACLLVNRGGPAVLVAGVGDPTVSPSPYREFYGLLIHDFALDDARRRALGPGVASALFGGAGREDGLRVSTVGLELTMFSRMLGQGLEPRPEFEEFRSLFVTGPGETEARRLLDAIAQDWEGFRFDIHERQGLLPLAEHLSHIRELRRVPTTARAPRAPTGPRFVNSALWRDADGDFTMIPQEAPPLVAGQPCHLQIWIGPRDVRLRTLDAAAIIEEVFNWSPDMDGVWVELGVAGIDFEVLGDPVQELWLPREEPSEPVYFAVVPRRSGVALLRFGLYYRNNLLQSFLFGARVREADQPQADDDARALAAAMSVGPERVGDACYMARLEYARTGQLTEVAAHEGRALTIVANRLQGRAVLTIKGTDLLETEVRPNDEMPDIVSSIRTSLDVIAFDRIPGLDLPQYRFLGGPEDRRARCEAAIAKLASDGWRLFLNLAPTGALQKKVRELLDGERKTIHVAQILRDKVIPWAFVYDRSYDDKSKTIDGQPVAQGACLAALPRQGTSFETLTCGTHATCLLNPERQAERAAQGLPRYHERTVACPLRFWGFRHAVEVPPQQQDSGPGGVHEERRAITPNGPLTLLAGLNATLALHESHWKELKEIAAWTPPQYDRDQILDALRKSEPDLIYFFCHARGGQVDPGTNPPYLEFQLPGGSPGQVRPQDFGGDPAWAHGPLVVLNACGTLGYSPDALSPFLTSLVDGREASGVLGTEVPVAEALAQEVAREFISRFIAGTSAGQALLDARRVLLADRNPLGLVYTLFAAADLAIKR